jgi:nicotinate-nucleotide pyrophosphorylase (carboxylating)
VNEFETFLAAWAMPDPFYERILGEKKNAPVRALLRSQEDGWLAGIPFAQQAAQALKVEAHWEKRSGEKIEAGKTIGRFHGNPESILKLENLLIGLIAKPSGIATAGRRAIEVAGGKIRLVCGGWKKYPFTIREGVREAVAAGGLEPRMLNRPFLYLDKNYVRIFGGIAQTLRAVAHDPSAKVIQVRGEYGPIEQETQEAIRNGAQVIMVDTGSWEDLDRVLRVMRQEKPLPKIQIAFAGGIRIQDIPDLVKKGVDILDIGAAILDAPWLELSYDIVKEGNGSAGRNR